MRLDISVGMGFVVETGTYCVYTCLFVSALPVMTSVTRRQDARTAKSAWVFLIFTILMYLVATIHLVFAAFRVYKSIFVAVDPNGPISYLRQINHWEFQGLLFLVCIQTWLGDILVIYRCYCVWNNNLWLISIPVCLLLCSFGINFYLMYWFRHPFAVALGPTLRLLSSIYPIAFIQNFMTTSLIILKILLQHRASKKAGVADVGSKLGLIRVVRIFIESAAIYTIQMFVLVILSRRGENFQNVVLAAVAPSIGITFVLLAIRVEASRSGNSKTSNGIGFRSTMLSRWARNTDSETFSKDDQGSSSPPAEYGNEVDEQKSEVQGVSTDNTWDVEYSSNSANLMPPKATSASLDQVSSTFET